MTPAADTADDEKDTDASTAQNENRADRRKDQTDTDTHQSLLRSLPGQVAQDFPQTGCLTVGLLRILLELDPPLGGIVRVRQFALAHMAR